MNRRIFLAVLGATAAVAAVAQGKRSSARPSASLPGGICFHAEARCEPDARPRTAAITYLILES